MKAIELIRRIIEAHRQNDDSRIFISPKVSLAPQLNYKGKAAREAFLRWMKHLNYDRKYAGAFDYKIFYDGKPISHVPHVIRPATAHLSIDILRQLHQGHDPDRMNNLSNLQKNIAHCIQAAFAEQEINWGEEAFQQRTYFGRSDMQDEILQESAPRDYQMVYIERCKSLQSEKGLSTSESIEKCVKLRQTAKTGKTVALPLDQKSGSRKRVLADFEKYMPRVLCGRPIDKWITPFVKQSLDICSQKGENPHAP